MDPIQVPVSPGELLDKITILEIKSQRMTDPAQLDNVRHELNLLREVWHAAVVVDDTVRSLHVELREVNEALWDIEDAIRDKERAGRFDDRFIELARSVYRTNDQRSRIKRNLNRHLGSRIAEEKSYRAY